MSKGGNMAIYETVVILDSLLPPKEIDDFVERCSSVIAEHGGKVRTIEKWGKRRLAYEIQKKQYGFYFSIEFDGEGEIPSVLQSEYNFNDNVLRYLTYRFDKHKLQSLSSKKPAEKPVEVRSSAPAEAKPVKEVEKASEVDEKNEEEA